MTELKFPRQDEITECHNLSGWGIPTSSCIFTYKPHDHCWRWNISLRNSKPQSELWRGSQTNNHKQWVGGWVRRWTPWWCAFARELWQSNPDEVILPATESKLCQAAMRNSRDVDIFQTELKGSALRPGGRGFDAQPGHIRGDCQALLLTALSGDS